MAGEEKGLASLMKSKNNHIFVLNDIAHMYNLICKYSLQAFPERIIMMIKGIVSHFKYSSRRRSILNEIQEKNFGINPKQVISYKEIRWLSLSEALLRLIELWEPLKIYFTKHGNSEEEEYFRDINYGYITILETLVQKLSEYNINFQSQYKFYNEDLKTMQESYRLFYLLGFSRRYEKENKKSFEDAFELPFEDSNKIKQLIDDDDTFITNICGKFKGVNNAFEKMTVSERKEVAGAGKNFILQVLKEMKKRLPLVNEELKPLDVIYYREENPEFWHSLYERFSHLRSKKIRE